ncbi:LUD domain-containing protein [Mangrovibacterium marinum]|uniref:L-lactate dehydrogenase complex protein LldG n=1 Tax=Mangrovibacterium marinum TaxID=1639118 RepID=A0A2T5C5Y0_9BACT|nr:LUD domain-containing protein [Mangrovibacterium marinum]PTN10306.1 L-lactate dehydrogenase complex protein LldG [Mangrovibacterium marinum]
MSSRENILARIKQARESRPEQLIPQPDFGSPIYHEPNGSLADWFQENLELVAGTVLRPQNLSEAVGLIAQLQKEENWQNLFCADPQLQKALSGQVNIQQNEDEFLQLDAGITGCEFLVAHLGSVMISSASPSGRRLHVFPETHLVVAHQRQLVKYLDDAMMAIQAKYHGKLPSSITNITGPSRTADIEKTLVMGMHGPKKLLVLLCDEPF